MNGERVSTMPGVLMVGVKLPTAPELLLKIRTLGTPGIAFVAILAVWQAVSSFGLLSEGSFPSPLQCARGMKEILLNGKLFSYSVASLFRVTVGWYLAVVTAIPLGLLLGWTPSLHDAMNPVLQFLRPISPLAWIPLAMIWFGIGDPPAVFLIFLASFFPLVVATMGAAANIKRIYIRAARNIGLRGTAVLVRVVFPAALPSIIVSLRISLGIAWLVVVAAEMIAVKSGLGFLIIDSRNALRLDLVVDGMIGIGLIGIVLDQGVRKLEQVSSMRWAIGQTR